MGILSGLAWKASHQDLDLKEMDPKSWFSSGYKVFAYPTLKRLVIQQDSVTCYFHVHLTRYMKADILNKILHTNSLNL